jgi:hypothetical protein
MPRASTPARTLVLGAAAAFAVAAPAPAAAAVKIQQLVVQRDGKARQAAVKAKATHVKVHGDSCKVPSATALAALVLSDVPKLRLHDYGSCSDRAQDAGGLFVRALGGDRNKGQDGWVYKVSNRLGTAGAADPTGPFGHGRLAKGRHVTWFYCHLKASTHSCQPTLGLTAEAGQAETLHVHVNAYDDRGHRSPAAGATVHAGQTSETTDKNGDADLVVPPGRYLVFAEKHGAVRTFGEDVDVGS